MAKSAFSSRIASGEVQALDLILDKASLQDKEGRFALNDVHFTLPWRARSTSVAELDIGGGRVLALPIGRFKTTINLQDKNISIPRLGIPILGGSLNIE